MNKRLRCIALCVLCVVAAAQFPLIAEEKKDDHTPVPYTKAEFPLWQRELRRFEILSFGALPFVTLFSFWGYDMIRAIQHPKDPGYYPWPFKQADKAVALTEKEQLGVFLTAAGISVTIALIDITYRAIKRSVEKKRLERENAFTEDPIQFMPTTLPIEDEPKPADKKPAESVPDAVQQAKPASTTAQQQDPAAEKAPPTAPLTSAEQISGAISIQEAAVSGSIAPSGIPARMSDTAVSDSQAPSEVSAAPANTVSLGDSPGEEGAAALPPAGQRDAA